METSILLGHNYKRVDPGSGLHYWSYNVLLSKLIQSLLKFFPNGYRNMTWSMLYRLDLRVNPNMILAF